ncbi:MAG: putative bifunctional diguanylate cyclase/phosphodiesterase, partial [Mycobacteriales bacterium]
AAAQRIAGLGSWWIDVSTDGEFVESTQRWSDETFRIFGYDPGSVDVRQAFEVFNRHLHPDDAAQMRREMLHALQQGKDASVEYRIVRPDGEVRAVRQRCSVVFDEHNGRPVRFIGTLQDVTDTKRLEERLSHQASHDALTGLPNRRALLRRLEGAFASGGAVAVLFCDIDHFAMINTRFGHEGGDRLLSQLGQRMREALPPECMLGRWGGDEFVAITDGTTDARALGTRLQEAVRAPIAVDGVPVRLDLSVGVAYGPAGGAEQLGPEDVLRDADLAMRGVRGEGGGGVAVADDEIRRLARRRRDLTQGLRAALEDGELTLAYQPRVSLEDGGLLAFEVEVRWEHPEHGLVPADELVWTAEESGAIHAVGAWVLETACRQLAAWQHRYPHLASVAVAVSLSAAQLDRADLVEEVAAILKASGLPAGSLELEVTESVLMADPARNAGVLDELRELGVRLTVDDFGGGFSSLAYLHRFPLHTLKIDRAFAAGVAVPGGDREIVRLLLAVATELGLRTVAEGVDAAEAAAVLRELGCEQAQGGLFARPMPAPAAERLLASAVRHPATAPPPSPRPPSG